MNETGNGDEKIIEQIKKINDELKLFIEAVEVRLTLRIEEINRKVVHLKKDNDKLKNKIEILE